MAEYSANAVQTVNPGEAVVFTDSPVPCNKGLVRHRDGSGSFLLSGYTPFRCRQANYLIEFGANIAVPEGGTAGEISLSLSLDGTIVPSSRMVVTPAAAEDLFNVGRAINVQVWPNCYETISVINTSDQAILVQNANIIINRPDLVMTR